MLPEPTREELDRMTMTLNYRIAYDEVWKWRGIIWCCLMAQLAPAVSRIVGGLPFLCVATVLALLASRFLFKARHELTKLDRKMRK